MISFIFKIIISIAFLFIIIIENLKSLNYRVDSTIYKPFYIIDQNNNIYKAMLFRKEFIESDKRNVDTRSH